MDTNTEKLHRQIRALLSKTVGNGCSEAEAASAAGILQELLTRHNLSMADLEARGSAAKPNVGEQGHDLGKAAFRWKLDLAEAVADHFYCHGLVDRTAKTVKFVGRPDNVESLLMLYAWLIEQIKQISSAERKVHIERTGEHVDPLRWQVNFGVGCVSRLGTRLGEMKAKAAQDMARNSQGDVVGLTLHHKSEVSDYLETKYGFRTDGAKTARAKKWEEEYAKEMEWKKRDPEGYYTAKPWLRPTVKTPEELAKDEAEREKAAKKWDAKWQRKVDRERNRVVSEEEKRRNEQGYEARQAGREAAAKINLQPFLKGTVDDKEKLP